MTLPAHISPRARALAYDVARALHDAQVRAKKPALITLAELAQHAYWQAQNLRGFTGPLEAWQALVQEYADAMPIGRMAPPHPPAADDAKAPPETRVLAQPAPRIKIPVPYVPSAPDGTTKTNPRTVDRTNPYGGDL